MTTSEYAGHKFYEFDMDYTKTLFGVERKITARIIFTVSNGYMITFTSSNSKYDSEVKEMVNTLTLPWDKPAYNKFLGNRSFVLGNESIKVTVPRGYYSLTKNCDAYDPEPILFQQSPENIASYLENKNMQFQLEDRDGRIIICGFYSRSVEQDYNDLDQNQLALLVEKKHKKNMTENGYKTDETSLYKQGQTVFIKSVGSPSRKGESYIVGYSTIIYGYSFDVIAYSKESFKQKQLSLLDALVDAIEFNSGIKNNTLSYMTLGESGLVFDLSPKEGLDFIQYGQDAEWDTTMKESNAILMITDYKRLIILVSVDSNDMFYSLDTISDSDIDFIKSSREGIWTAQGGKLLTFSAYEKNGIHYLFEDVKMNQYGIPAHMNAYSTANNGINVSLTGFVYNSSEMTEEEIKTIREMIDRISKE